MFSELGSCAATCADMVQNAMSVLADPNATPEDIAQAKESLQTASQMLASLSNMMGRAPYVKTPQEVVDAMLQLANLQPDDILYDLGSGDGRIMIAAAQRYGVRAV